ncbi:RNA polymerase sigma factor [Algisphaera agarilytica]
MRDGRKHLRRATRILSDTAIAEDVCQHAYLKAIEKQGQIRDPEKLPGWINRVVTNAALDQLRHRERQQQAYSARGEHPTSQLNGEDRLVESETQDELYQLLDRLDEPVRQVVVMRTIQGMTGNEVKQSLGCSAALVSKRLHRGLDQLRQWIRESQREGVAKP